MPDNLILDFPVLRKDSNDFPTAIAYEVKAEQINGKLYIKHSLKGRSFISSLLEQGKAKFSVRLLYRDSSERQHHLYDGSIPSMQEDIIAITQTIPMDFSYAPEIMPSIIVLENVKITMDTSSELTDFERLGKSFFVPRYARIAIVLKLIPSIGYINRLMRWVHNEDLGDGEMRVIINEYAREGEVPVSLLCGSDVYNQLRKASPAEPSNRNESISSAIVTQALCATYAYMHNLDYENKKGVGGVLLSHLQILEENTGQNWKDGNFNPSLAATKMKPYALGIFRGKTMMSEYSRLYEKVWEDFGKKLTRRKGSEEQREFLAACRAGKEEFLAYLKHNNLADSVSDGESVNFTHQFTEREFVYPPYDTQKKIWETFKGLPDEIICKCGFWAYVIIKMIEDGYIQPSYLASEPNDIKSTGSYMIDNALTSNNAKKIDKRVRRVLRSMCNPAPRGKRIILNDFYLGKTYWRWRWADKMSNIMKPNLTLQILDEKYYAEFSARMYSRKSCISSKNIFGGLLLFLEKNREISDKNLAAIIDQIGYLSAWKAIEAQDPKSNQKEIEKIAERL